MNWYSTWCTDDADLPMFEYLMAQHQAAQAAAGAGAEGGQLLPINQDVYTLQVRVKRHGMAALPRYWL